MLLWDGMDSTEKYKLKNGWKWGITSSKQPWCWWVLTVQGILCYIISCDPCLIFSKFTSHAIIF